MAPQQNLPEADASVKFCLLTDQLLSSTRSKPIVKNIIDACLLKFISFDYRSIVIENNVAVMDLVNQLCINIKSSETLLVKNYCQFIIHITKAGATMRGRTFLVCERWLLDALEYSDVEARPRILLALQIILGTGPFDLITRSQSNIWDEKGLLMRLVHPLDNDWSETNFLAVLCFEAILLNKDRNNATIPSGYGQIIKDIVIHILYSLSYESCHKFLYNKMVRCCLRALCKLTAGKLITMEHSGNRGEILGIVKALLFHGIEGYLSIKPQCLWPAAMNLPEGLHVPPRGRNLRSKGKSKRPTNKGSPDEKMLNQFPIENLANCCKYLSDPENEDFDLDEAASLVRLEASRLLYTASVEISARDMFGYWPQIVASGSRESARVLTRCALKEPVSKVRQSVLCTLSKLLIDAKNFLIHADDSEHPSFLTFFGTVGAMIRELHFTLALVLSYEKSVLVLTHALKCAAGLVRGTPYARLKRGLATKISRNCRPHLLHEDPTVRVSAITVFEALASLNRLTPEILDILGKQANTSIAVSLTQVPFCARPGDSDEEHKGDKVEFAELSCHALGTDSEPDEEASPENRVSSLLEVCLKDMSNESEKSPVRLEALKLLGALAFNVQSLVFPHLESVTPTLAVVATDLDVQVARHACRVIETIAGRLANSNSEAASISAFWNVIFAPVITLVQNSQSSLREVACDCLGNIGSTMFGELSREKSVLIITILFGAVRDEESSVRAAAVRALGMLVTLPPLEEDTGFLLDLVDILCLAIEDPNLGVRVKVAWALANLCYCLINYDDNSEAEPVPLDIILPRLYSVTVKAAEDNCKVKCNAVRAVGCVMRLSSDRYILKDVSQGLEILIKCATRENDMKVRWNACHALGFVMSYKPDATLPLSWRDQVFPTLSDVVCHSPNFKVRTNAAWALASCDYYSKYMPSLWKTISVALENSHHVPSFVEYSHRDVLVQQLCLTLSHLALCTEAADLQAVWMEIRDHIDDITIHMKQLQDRVVPEKASDLVEAKTHLQKLFQNAVGREERLIANNLRDLFERTNPLQNCSETGNKN